MLAINEIFETIQGEGVFTGVPAIFVRLQGCPVGCPWCDTQQTWALNDDDQIDPAQMILKTGDTPAWSSMTAQQVLQLFSQQQYTAKHVVITGGEPCMFDLREFTTLLHQQGYRTQIETSGTFEVRCDPATWVTVSPKLDMPGGYEVRADAMARANEIKHPIAMQKHVDALDALLSRCPVQEGTTICLQPISQRPRATQLAIDICRQRNWRLSVQLHKYLAIA
ncbi:7-carboxy-7-deazaguanine synthase QueE [Aliidiomarina maris]|uniref:7-carboxy-7-deazaguanine synthase n=1 Tax=Aliidiomarina maris TaxID=531312 RepID=A0A327WND5_9GAMM|nr:7-carboxy-7-deazaguanine synthase QueE [Aliidiomarina maris]RAJ93683.1 7-carboxy-7-deazaguanine synthase [Aliidiomarina maris]RUO19400.1 7-carboxy-7-deazaguanine synthase QueE [Aliidiomarina maris]